MGYQRPPLKLTFETPELDGLEVRARRLSVAEVRTVVQSEGTRFEREQLVLGVLVAAIREWNYCDDDGDPVKLTVEDLDTRVDRVAVDAIVEALLDASVRVAPPLPQPSDGGSPSVEEFKLMAPLSDDPPSSPGPS